MNGLWNSLSRLFQMKRRMTQRPREEQALRCFPCPRSPTILICVVTVEFHPGDTKRLVGECSGEQISLWERTAKKNLIREWLLQEGKRWALMVSEESRVRLAGVTVLRSQVGQANSEAMTVSCCWCWNNIVRSYLGALNAINFLRIILEG